MNEKRKENWINIETPEGKKMIASPEFVKKMMGLDLSNIYNRLIRMESQIDKLESPQRQEKIIETLRGQGKHNRLWLDYRVDFRWYDLGDLIRKGIIVESRSGKHRMFELSE